MTAGRALALIAVVGLAGCATGQPVTASSNCHTSDGQYVGWNGCTISYSSSPTVTTTTTTVTTTEVNAPPAAGPSDGGEDR